LAASGIEEVAILAPRSQAMRRYLFLAVLTVAPAACGAAAQQPASMRIPAPELREVKEWINSRPLKLSEQRGKVVVVHFWAFG
jgi:hypothetical protein